VMLDTIKQSLWVIHNAMLEFMKRVLAMLYDAHCVEHLHRWQPIHPFLNIFSLNKITNKKSPTNGEFKNSFIKL